MIKKLIKYILNKLGYNIVSNNKIFPIPEANSYERAIISKALNFSMTNELRAWSLIQAIKYIINNNIEGDFVECGVYKGGNLLIFKNFKDKFKLNKSIYGYDTFEGMSAPISIDKRLSDNESAETILSQEDKHNSNKSNFWCYASINEVKKNLDINNNLDQINLIKGKVETTLKQKINLPNKISILRLDTDFYESTKIELEILYPLLSDKGVLIIDDYGYWKGAKKAVDEYFKNKNVWFHYIDHDCRLLIKNKNE